jgi:uncharacterized membrane protein HdeD (DUF308 family)
MADQITIETVGVIGTEQLRRAWGWFVGLGVLLILLGTVGLMYSVVTTIATVVFFGWLLIVAGILQTVHGFMQRQWSGFFLDLIAGILYIVVGFFLVIHPAEGAVSLTLLVAMFLLLGGGMRIAIAFAADLPHRGWLLLDGVVSIALGIMIWMRWPVDGLWVIGLFVGIQMVFSGWTLLMLGLAARRLARGL